MHPPINAQQLIKKMVFVFNTIARSYEKLHRLLCG